MAVESKSHNAAYYAQRRMFADAKAALEDLERFERLEARRKMKPGEPVKDYLRRTRAARRERMLNVLVPDRVCPACGEHRPRSRQWVIRKGEPVVCRSCAWNKGDEK